MSTVMKKSLTMLLALVLAVSLLCVPAMAEEGSSAPQLGDAMSDFTFTTFDGSEYTLSEALAEKEMVLINIWATWCGPCQAEFPFMEEAYEQYKDKIEIFALSCEPEDTDEVLAEYVAEMGMTFPVGQDTPGLADLFEVNAIPTSIVVDRFGNICFVEAGSQTSLDNFVRLFDTFLGDEYTESVLLDGVPPAIPDVEPASEEELADALAGGGELSFYNPDDEYNWPVSIQSDDERSYVTTTNAGISGSTSSVGLHVSAKEGDVLALDYKVSSEAGYDFLTIMLDGDPIKRLSGERDWAPYAYEFTADGDYAVTLTYVKDEASDEGDDAACFSNVRILSGDEAAEALAAMPVYPHGEKTALTVANESALPVVIDDPEDLLTAFFGGVSACYIVPDDEISYAVTLAEGVDADGASAYTSSGVDTYFLADCVDGDGYAFTDPTSRMEDGGRSYTLATLSTDEEEINVLCFASEENLNSFLHNNFVDENGELAASWTYADGAEPGTDAYYSSYSLVFQDQDGEPVEGVIANVCTDDACTPMTSDADGLIEFVDLAYAYHIQVIKVPDGYEYDTSAEEYAEESGGEMVFTLTKN